MEERGGKEEEQESMVGRGGERGEGRQGETQGQTRKREVSSHT